MKTCTWKFSRIGYVIFYVTYVTRRWKWVRRPIPLLVPQSRKRGLYGGIRACVRVHARHRRRSCSASVTGRRPVLARRCSAARGGRTDDACSLARRTAHSTRPIRTPGRGWTSPAPPHRIAVLPSWLRGPAVEHWSLADVLSLSCARLVADGWPPMWVSYPL